MNHGYVVYDANESATYFFQAQVDKMCEFIGTTIKNFKERAYSKRKSQSIGGEYEVYMLDNDDNLILLIGEEES
jgi:hypothetical protein